MMPIPAPDTQQATDKLNELWRSAHRYFDEDDLRLRSLAKLGRELLRSDAASGWTILSGVAALTGDVKSAVENADKAIRLSSDVAHRQGKATALGNLGYFSKANRIFREILSIDMLTRPEVGEAIAYGCILALDEAVTNAGKMPIAISDSLRKKFAVAASILRQNSVTDDDVGTWLDTAGEIMREQRLFFLDQPLLFATTEEDFSQVDLSFVLDVDPEQAAKLNLNLVEHCIRAGNIPPECFSFGFRSNPELNERIAA
jgi:hypothetical protein